MLSGLKHIDRLLIKNVIYLAVLVILICETLRRTENEILR
jgi:hypothetical protein